MTESIDRILGRLEEKVDRLIEDQRNDKIEISARIAKVEEVTNEYRALKTMGRGYLLATAIGGGGLGLWLHDTVAPFFKALKG